MNTSQRQYQNKDARTFDVDILNIEHATKFQIDYKSFVKLDTGLSELNIYFSVYGRLDRIEQREFNDLRKQSFKSIPENAFKVEINRFNKRKWKREHDSVYIDSNMHVGDIEESMLDEPNILAQILALDPKLDYSQFLYYNYPR